VLSHGFFEQVGVFRRRFRSSAAGIGGGLVLDLVWRIRFLRARGRRV
jgi:hypothetical protein